MNRAALVGLDRAGFVDRATQHVHDAAEGGFTHRHFDAFAGIGHRHAATQAIGRAKCDGTHDAVAELLLHLEGQADLGQTGTGVFQHQRVIDPGHRVARELDVNHRADALNDMALLHVGTSLIRFDRVRIRVVGVAPA